MPKLEEMRALVGRLRGEKPSQESYAKLPVVLENLIKREAAESSVVYFPPYLFGSSAEIATFFDGVYQSDDVFICHPSIYGRKDFSHFIQQATDRVALLPNPKLFGYSSGCRIAQEIGNNLPEAEVTLIAPVMNIGKKPMQRAMIYLAGRGLSEINLSGVFPNPGNTPVESPVRAFKQAKVNASLLK